jgi:osmotically-inducible protein OsmY
MKAVQFKRLAEVVAVAAALAGSLGACTPLVVGGAIVGGGMVAIDRRTAGTQVDDQTIEFKGAARARDLAPAGHINVTSYNRLLLITGEVPSESDRKLIEEHITRIEGVRSVVNELAVMPNSSLGTRSSDSIISGKVKAAYVDAKDLQAHAIKVVTERGTVFLMGLVTEREAGRATEIARSVGGVQKVVRLFQVISEAELASMQPPPPK